MKQTLMEYLLAEITLDIDDPNDNIEVKRQLNQAKRNPERARREQMLKAKKDLKTAQKSDNSPTKSIDIKIANTKQQLANLQQQKQNIKKRTKAQTESLNIPADICEVVYTDENDNILHVGDSLTESAIQAFKRTGNVIKRQYRCTSGRKLGRIVANPNDCNKRKNPKKIKAGRKAARMNKSARITKTKIAKKKSISKMVTNLNKRFKK